MMRKLYYFSGSKLQSVQVENNKPKLYLYLGVGILFVIAIIFTIYSLASSFITTPNRFYYKDVVQKKILLAVKNNADLQIIKEIYSNLESNQINIGSYFKDKDNIYASDVPLSIILSDTRSNLYLSDTPPDSITVSRLSKIINEHNEINPFDKLAKYQKDYFENVRIKLNDNYPLVSNGLNKISDDLYSKNLLVEEYLSDSKISFWISIIALIFSISIGLFQIIQNRSFIVRNDLEQKEEKTINT